MNNDMSDMVKNLNNMLDGNQIPENVKDMLSSLMQSTNKVESNSESSSKDTINSSDSDFSNIDINTIMKMQEIIKSMNSETNSSRANLLRSLKPYLKPSRQEKVDQYIQLFNMEKVFKMLNNNGKF